MMYREPKYKREAVERLPTGYYLLPVGEQILPSDLVWAWNLRRWLRADSMVWLFSPLLPENQVDMIAAARRASESDYAARVPAKRIFTLKK